MVSGGSEIVLFRADEVSVNADQRFMYGAEENSPAKSLGR